MKEGFEPWMCSFFSLVSDDVLKYHPGTQYWQVLKVKRLGLVLVTVLVVNGGLDGEHTAHLAVI